MSLSLIRLILHSLSISQSGHSSFFGSPHSYRWTDDIPCCTCVIVTVIIMLIVTVIIIIIISCSSSKVIIIII